MTKDTKLGVLLHELGHVKQCIENIQTAFNEPEPVQRKTWENFYNDPMNDMLLNRNIYVLQADWNRLTKENAQLKETLRKIWEWTNQPQEKTCPKT